MTPTPKLASFALVYLAFIAFGVLAALEAWWAHKRRRKK